MAMEPLPNGFEDFSIAMDPSQASLWPLPTTTTLGQDDLRCCRPLEGVEEVKQLLAAATAELQAASEELRRKEQNIAALVDLGRDTVKERDLLLEQQVLLVRELEAMASSSSDSGWSALLPSPAPVAVDGSPMFKPFAVPSSAVDGSEDSGWSALLPSPAPVAVDGSPMFKPFAVPSSAVDGSEDSSTATALEVPRFAAVAGEAALEVPRFAEVTGEDSSRDTVLALKAPRLAAVVHEDKSKVAALELLAAKRPLPQMLQAVMDAGPLLQNSSRDTVLALKAPRLAAVVHEDKSKVAALELLAAKRPLPQKGQMLQAVMDAGPLLQNLMVAGSLPKWRNPPRTQALANAMIPAPSVSGAHMGLPRSTH